MGQSKTNQITSTTINQGNREFVIQKKFDSKKNQVYLVTDPSMDIDNKVVLKIYNEEFKKNAKREIDTLTKTNLLDIPTPKIIEYSKDWVLLEYVPGRSILQIIDSEPREKEPEELIMNLAEWFTNLHGKTFEYTPTSQVLLKGDCVLKNFIYNHDSDQIYGVDFEECTIGEPGRDLGAVCSAILTIKPMFSTLNFKLCKLFTKFYKRNITKYLAENSSKNVKIVQDSINKSSIATWTASALASAASWMSKDNSELVLKWSKKIKNKKSLSLL